MNGGSKTEIKASQIATHLRTADAYVTKVEWAAKQDAPAPGNLYRERLLAQARTTPSASLSEMLKNVRKDGSTILDKAEHRVLHDVRRGIQVGLAVADEYRRATGIEQVGDLSKLAPEKVGVIQEKLRTAAAVTLFTLARYVSEGLADADDQAHREHVVLPECNLENPISALRCALFYLCMNIAHPSVSNDKALNATVAIFFEKILDEIEVRKATFAHLEQFQSIAFGIEGEEFTIEGLDRHKSGAVSVEFKRKDIGENVGNADAKHFIRRTAQRLASYNFTAQKNVFMEFGGLMDPWMGYGKPGTGKSDLIAILATLLDDLCKMRGVPFMFHPLPDNLIDSYQGNSARNMVNWMKVLSAPDKIVFGSIDDAENVLEERTRQGVSEGVRAVIGVFLRYTEGAYAIRRGNSTIGIMTNLPEQLDAAIRSRVQGRMVIDGFKTVHDALDQSQLWWKKRYGNQPGFVNLKDPANYVYQSDQRLIRSASEASQTRDAPEHAAMREIWQDMIHRHNPETHEFFAEWMVAVMSRYPAFSSRDLRNIHSATDQRVMDFDLPEQWFENPDVFHGQSYDRQVEMVSELRTANMKGLKFGQILLQETVRYLDNYARIADQQFDREVDARLHELRVQDEVRRRATQSLKGAA